MTPRQYSELGSCLQSRPCQELIMNGPIDLTASDFMVLFVPTRLCCLWCYHANTSRWCFRDLATSQIDLFVSFFFWMVVRVHVFCYTTSSCSPMAYDSLLLTS